MTELGSGACIHLTTNPDKAFLYIDRHEPIVAMTARARGRKGGRPPMKKNDRRIVLANKLLKDKSIGIDDICVTLKISRRSSCRPPGDIGQAVWGRTG